MTDTITPALAHRVLDVLEQSPHIGPDGSLSALFIVRDAVRAWEAESARDEEAERYAEVYHEAGPSESKWAALHPQSRSTLVGRMRAALDRLAADGRLLPEGGTVLTEEQVADLRWLMAQYVGFNGDIDCPPYASLDALFTTPAAPVPDSRVHNHGPAEGRGLDCPERMVDGQLRGVCMDSGPDGTPEKPWPTWQDVPEGVRYCSRKQRHHRWVNRNGERFTVAFSNDNEHPAVADEKTMKLRAPFVRVDGDKA